MAADAMAPCVTMPSAVTVLTTYDQQVFAFHGEEFQLPVPSKFWEMIEN